MIPMLDRQIEFELPFVAHYARLPHEIKRRLADVTRYLAGTAQPCLGLGTPSHGSALSGDRHRREILRAVGWPTVSNAHRHSRFWLHESSDETIAVYQKRPISTWGP